MNLSIIIPLYNEAGVITRTLDRLQELTFPPFVEHTEVVIVDDCSSDESARLAGEYTTGAFRITLIRLSSNRGKGAAVTAGIKAAQGDTILVQDADLELDPADIPPMLERMHSGNLDLVSGTRFSPRRRYPSHALPATIANRFFSSAASLITGMRITDITCGYKLFTRALAAGLDLKEERFGFETELMMKGLKTPGIRFSEHPVSYYPRKIEEGKKIRVSDGLLIAGKLFSYGLKGRRWISAMTIALIIFFMAGNMLEVKHWKEERRVIEWDAISYYAYLPALFIYHDLSLGYADSYDGPHRLIVWPEKTPEGNNLIKTTMGVSLLWMPFFLAGHLAAVVTGADAGGYSEPYKFFLLVSAITYLLIGLVFLRRILLEHFSDRIASMTLAGFTLATNLYWYTLFQGTMSHVYSFALMSAFLWYTMEWYRDRNLSVSPPESGGVASQSEAGVVRHLSGTGNPVWHALRLGLLLGLISLIRPTNIIIILFFLLYAVNTGIDLKGRIKKLASDYRYLLIMILIAVIVWIPQLIYWKEITGHWLYFSYGSDEKFFFNDPAIIKGLFSFRKGLFIYTPMLLLSVAGIAVLWMRRSPHALPVTVFFPLNAYIILSWWCWWYGGGFGQRAFIDSYALMAVAAAALLSYTMTSGGKFLRISILSVYLALVTLGIFNNIQYYHGAIHWDSMTREAYMDSFGRIRPSGRFNDLLEAPDYEKAREGAGR